jgi:hypothetical protein
MVADYLRVHGTGEARVYGVGDMGGLSVLISHIPMWISNKLLETVLAAKVVRPANVTCGVSGLRRFYGHSANWIERGGIRKINARLWMDVCHGSSGQAWRSAIRVVELRRGVIDAPGSAISEMAEDWGTIQGGGIGHCGLLAEL